jgi:hypothetical protein
MNAYEAIPNEAVVLVHGLGRTPLSMALLGHRLTRAGYEVRRFGYLAALGDSIDTLARRLKRAILERVEAPTFHLVTHSLGGIIARAGCREPWPPTLGRVVMLAPPNQPPELASVMGGSRAFRTFAGAAGASLADPEFFRSLPVPDVPFGVIAGTVGHRLGFDEPNDGIVTVAGTRLEGMCDFLEVPRIHTFIMNAPEVAEATVRFLRHGCFAETEAAHRDDLQ